MADNKCCTVHVETPSGEVSVCAPADSSVKAFKTRLQCHIEAPLSHFHLHQGALQLHDDVTLHDYNVTDGSSLKLTVKVPSIPIYVKTFNGEFISILAQLSDTKRELKAKVAGAGIIEAAPYVLVHKGHEIRSEEPIGYHGVQPGDVLLMRLIVFVRKNQDSVHLIFANPRLPVRALVADVCRAFRLPQADLSHPAKGRLDFKQTMDQYGIKHRDVLTLIL